MAYEIRERDIGGVLDEAIILFRDHFKLLLLISVFILMPANLIVEVLAARYEQSAPQLDPATTPSDAEALRLATLAGAQAFLFMFVVLAITIVYGSWVEGAVIHSMASRYLGRPVPTGESFKVGLRRLPVLAAANLLVLLAGFFGACLCILPGLLLVALYCIAPAAVILEHAGPMEALSRSYRLIRSYLWQTLGLILAIGVLEMGLGMFGALVPAHAAVLVISAFLESVFTVFSHLTLLMLYFSVRCRVESLDLDLLTRAVEEPAALPEPAL